jgi:hypothetical protein
MRYMTLKLPMLALVLLAAACDGGHGTTVVMREDIEGQTRFHSRTLAMPGSASFECLASASGRCHYAVFDGACGQFAATLVADVIECEADATPTASFDLDVGERRDIDGLPLDFRHCVRERPGPMTAACLRSSRDAVARHAAPRVVTG